MNQELTEGIDFYFNENGLVVFTQKYLTERGYCCGSGCTNCPYEYIAVPEPKRSDLQAKRRNEDPMQDSK